MPNPSGQTPALQGDVRTDLERAMSEHNGKFHALCVYPGYGSVWMVDAKLIDGYVVGHVWDSSDAGSPYMPDDYRGQYDTMNFPVSCVRKIVVPPFRVGLDEVRRG